MRPAIIFTFTPLITSATLIRNPSKNSFKTLLSQNNLLLTAFSSLSYEPTQSFIKVFEQAAETIKTPCVLIDCDKEKELCKEYDVNAYPAVRLFKKGWKENDGDDETDLEVTRYRGKRTREGIISFMTKHELPAVTHVEPEHLQDFKRVDNIVVIAYLRLDQQALRDVFETVAAKHRFEFVFGFVDDVRTADAEGLAMPSIVCNKNTDGDNKVLNGHFTEADVEMLLEAAKTTVIEDFSEKNMDAYMVVSTHTQT
jgi:hypothetical protein